MAQYEDFEPPSASGATIYQQIADLLVGAYSVEVVPKGKSVLLRVWHEQHCDPRTHQALD